jgi:hypothetical protein
MSPRQSLGWEREANRAVIVIGVVLIVVVLVVLVIRSDR